MTVKEKKSILIQRIILELPSEASIECEIITNESSDEFKRKVKNDLKKYGIDVDVQLIFKEMT